MYQKGYKISKNQMEYRKKKGRISPDGLKRLSEASRKRMLGTVMSEEQKRKRSIKQKGLKAGNKHWNWKGGITPLRKKLYFSIEYKLWRKSVFTRDNYTCIWCGQKGGILNADHIKPWALFPELRFAIDNGRTLCEDCHKKTDTWGVHKKI